MAVREQTPSRLSRPRPLAALEQALARLILLDGETIAYLIIFVLAVLTRFWDLGVRTMSHDESLHTRFSWNLYRGDGFTHTPLMHGPLLFHMTALSYLLFGDNDFTARIYTAVVGVIVVMLPLFLRRWLGRTGALAASVLFLISPLILYYSRYIRHDMPAILGALVMLIAMLNYIERRDFKWLALLAVGQFVLFASKEVSFIYIAIFGSFLTLFLITRLLDVEWEDRLMRSVFVGALIALLLGALALGVALYLQGQAQAALIEAGEVTPHTTTPIDPDAPLPHAAASTPDLIRLLGVGGLGFLALVMVGATLAGQWHHLRRFPELGAAVAMGTLILPALTPFLITFAGFDPMDATPQGVMRSLAFTLPVIALSVLIGLIYFMKPPRVQRIAVPPDIPEDEIAALPGDYDPATGTVMLRPDLLDRLTAFLTSRWWVIGALYWLPFLFFFTTMFTNGSGIGTGIIGSLAYWLSQQEVERGGQPWYYYIMVLAPVYEFLPAILSIAAGAVGLGSVARWVARVGTSARRPPISLHAPVRFPLLLLLGYWIVVNFIAYSIAGEKMPWLTTHLTTPMILLGGWVLGRLLDRIQWRRLWETRAWVLLFLIPIAVLALLRSAGPLCVRVPTSILCNTIIPLRYQQGPFQGTTASALAATGAWFGALIVLVIALAAVIRPLQKIGVGQSLRLCALLVVGWLGFLTVQAAWRAAYINYDYANEFLVYAHSSGANKDVTELVEELSIKTTDGMGIRVAYDNRSSWPMSWYLRNFYNAIYFGDQPSRGLIGDAPVIIAGPENWGKVEPLLGDRYYLFEYTRMVWPMQDYFGYEDPAEMRSMLRDVLSDPALQRGLWEIFTRRDYSAYAAAVAPYRGGAAPTFELSRWPVSERMRVYIRKDVYAGVWDYGVTPSEIAAAVDPYAEGAIQLQPQASFGQGTLNRPHALALGPDGLIYVADTGNHRIAVFDQEGALIRTFGSYGAAPAPMAFNEPWGIAVGPDGTVYIADTWHQRIVACTSTGQYLREWGSEGLGEAGNEYGFYGPRAVAVDAQGLVYVADTGNKRIMVYDSQGTFIRQIGAGGTLEGQLDEPVGLAISPDGLLYVADTWNQRIQIFTREGLFLRQWPVSAWFSQSNERPYLAVDTQGSVYVTDPDAARVIVFDTMGAYRFSFGDFSTIGLAGAVLVTDEGNLYLSDTATGTIQRYTLAGTSGPIQ